MTCGTPWRRWSARIEGQDAFIPLTKGYWAVIDIADLPAVAPSAWQALIGRHTVYGKTVREDVVILLHNLILPPVRPGITDHRDRDGLNNRRSNLRPATGTLNNANRVSLSGKTPFKGVSFHKHSGLYQATITYGGRQHSLKYHPTPEAAARAYDAEALLVFGEFALTNAARGLL